MLQFYMDLCDTGNDLPFGMIIFKCFHSGMTQSLSIFQSDLLITHINNSADEQVTLTYIDATDKSNVKVDISWCK